MGKSWHALALVGVVVAPIGASAQSGQVSCDVASRLRTLQSAYVALYERPEAKEVHNLAVSAAALASTTSAAGTGAEVQAAVDALGLLARRIADARGPVSMTAAQRRAHLANMERLGNFSSPENCDPGPRPRLPAGDGPGFGTRAAIVEGETEIGLTDIGDRPPPGGTLREAAGPGRIGGDGPVSVFGALLEWRPDPTQFLDPRLIGGVVAAIAAAAFLVRAWRRFRRMSGLRRYHRYPFSRFVDLRKIGEDGYSRQAATDLSRGGMQLAITGGVPKSTRVEVRIDDVAIIGVVKWSNAYFCGVVFEDEITREQIAAILDTNLADLPEGEGPESETAPARDAVPG